MAPPQRTDRRRKLSAGLRLAGVLPVIMAAGCHNVVENFIKPAPQCVLPTDASKDQIVEHLNNNINRVSAWRSNDVDISTSTPSGIPIRLSANIAVESPRNFRLKAKSILGDEADFGSNPERFWFWMRRSKPKHVYTVRHDDFEALRGRLPIPFRPDWLMQALGVIPLDPAEFTMQPRIDGAAAISLVSDQTTPAGVTVRRVILVDSCMGRIIKQTLYDGTGRTIASAEFNDYRYDPQSGVTLAHEINFDWPQTKTAMTLRINTAQINPGPMPPTVWQMPRIDKYAVLDLGRHLGQLARREQPFRQQRRFDQRFAQKRGNTIPTPEQVGRVKIGPDSDRSVSPQRDHDRPDFESEQTDRSGDRPRFDDEQPEQSSPTPRFSQPIIERAQTGEQAKPFPG